MEGHTKENLIEQYPMEYCHMLELCYGEGMMSEGGRSAIDALFDGISLTGKRVLEIGFGLGGLAHYLSEKYPAIEYYGIEVNPKMHEYASQKYPQKNLNFILPENPDIMPFEPDYFDVVFSKGVLVHLQDKHPLFNELYRVLKSDGKFIINDWLSPDGKSFGKRVDQMCELENLALFPLSEASYQSLLAQSGFQLISTEDENKAYSQYNDAIVQRLKQSEIKATFLHNFTQKEYADSVDAYGWISEAFANNELLARKFLCSK